MAARSNRKLAPKIIKFLLKKVKKNPAFKKSRQR